MKQFLAVYIGTQAALERAKWNDQDARAQAKLRQDGVAAWMNWAKEHGASIVERGGPLGKTKRIGPDGISDVRNDLVGYVVVQAESHEAAAKLFTNHPHFSMLPGDSVELMECLPLSGQ